MPPAVPGANNGAPVTKWSSKVSTTTGSRSLHETPGGAVTETKSRPKNTPSIMLLSNSAEASGDASALSASAKSRVPASITVWPGRNLRVAGLGVCSVWISMCAMWSRDGLQSRTKGRRSADHPAGDREGCNQADERCPPFARAYRLGPGVERGLAGDHRPGEMAAAQPEVCNRGDVQDDQEQDDVEPQLVDVARGVRGAGADQVRKGAGVNAVLVLRDESEADLDGDRDEHCEDAERSQRRVAGARPAAAQVIAHRARTAHEIGEERGRA